MYIYFSNEANFFVCYFKQRKTEKKMGTEIIKISL